MTTIVCFKIIQDQDVLLFMPPTRFLQIENVQSSIPPLKSCVSGPEASIHCFGSGQLKSSITSDDHLRILKLALVERHYLWTLQTLCHSQHKQLVSNFAFPTGSIPSISKTQHKARDWSCSPKVGVKRFMLFFGSNQNFWKAQYELRDGTFAFSRVTSLKRTRSHLGFCAVLQRVLALPCK